MRPPALTSGVALRPEVTPRPFNDDASKALAHVPVRHCDKEVEVIRILVVDDSAPVRLRLMTLFAFPHDLVVCGDARDGRAGPVLARRRPPWRWGPPASS